MTTPPDILAQICATKRQHIAACEAERPLSNLQAMIKDVPLSLSFKYKIEQYIRTGKPALISEVKKASPSKGVIRSDFDPVDIAVTYEQVGACCLSILTDEPYFQGCDEYLAAVRAAVSLPLLRKDFMLTPYQIYESRALSADCVLLIMACLDDSQAQDLYALAKELGMDVLVETHNEEELQRALAFEPDIIGVNNRNLKTLAVDLQTALDLAPLIPDKTIKVAESGIDTHDDIVRLQTAGYQTFLVGESLMRQDDIGKAVHNLLHSP